MNNHNFNLIGMAAFTIICGFFLLIIAYGLQVLVEYFTGYHLDMIWFFAPCTLMFILALSYIEEKGKR